MKSCKTCRWLDVSPDKRGRRIVRQAVSYECNFPIAPLPPLPESAFFKDRWPPARSWMEGQDGRSCATWEPLSNASDAAETEIGRRDLARDVAED